MSVIIVDWTNNPPLKEGEVIRVVEGTRLGEQTAMRRDPYITGEGGDMVSDYVANPAHNDNHLQMGRRLNQKGYDNRAAAIRLQSGGLTGKGLFAKALRK